MHRKHRLNLGSLICLIAAVYVLYYLLLGNRQILPSSIHWVEQAVEPWTHSCHVLVIGLLPIYIALLVFGTAILGGYLGSALHRWISSFIRK